jgi:hypothetical protein
MVIARLKIITYRAIKPNRYINSYNLFINLIKKYILQDVPKRDRIAKELADKNSRYYRERKQKAIIQVQLTYVVRSQPQCRSGSRLCPHTKSFFPYISVFS